MTTVAEVMTRGVRTLAPTDTVVQAAQAMDELNVGVIPVCEGEKLVGMVTDRDIVTNVIARESDPRAVIVDDIMTRHPVSVWATSSVEDALQRMQGGGVRRVPVVDERGRLVGILALDDIFEHMAARLPFAPPAVRREREPPREQSRDVGALA